MFAFNRNAQINFLEDLFLIKNNNSRYEDTEHNNLNIENES